MLYIEIVNKINVMYLLDLITEYYINNDLNYINNTQIHSYTTRQKLSISPIPNQNKINTVCYNKSWPQNYEKNTNIHQSS